MGSQESKERAHRNSSAYPATYTEEDQDSPAKPLQDDLFVSGLPPSQQVSSSSQDMFESLPAEQENPRDQNEENISLFENLAFQDEIEVVEGEQATLARVKIKPEPVDEGGEGYPLTVPCGQSVDEEEADELLPTAPVNFDTPTEDHETARCPGRAEPMDMDEFDDQENVEPDVPGPLHPRRSCRLSGRISSPVTDDECIDIEKYNPRDPDPINNFLMTHRRSEAGNSSETYEVRSRRIMCYSINGLRLQERLNDPMHEMTNEDKADLATVMARELIRFIPSGYPPPQRVRREFIAAFFAGLDVEFSKDEYMPLVSKRIKSFNRALFRQGGEIATYSFIAQGSRKRRR
ncbi:hypothetical protein L596_028309 [Steinernema carpocapsae]|uniref:Uncharacterized protein n=1 Tax=Steinernema carpocapsae TaxID=34508 RepID=A0A4U5LY13_STECR|nr:hypothetical protein L596_028309 [Steinernema carpocapsae]